MTNDHNCGHKICNCPITGDDKFCSDHCREATEQDISEIACDCGCPSCG